MSEEQKEKKYQKKLGALWRGKYKNKNGEEAVYFSGNLEVVAGYPINIVLFPAEQKQLNSPAYNIFLNKQKEDKKAPKTTTPQQPGD